MKIILAALALWATIGCTSYRELQQIDMVQVKVVRIGTIQRSTNMLKAITWKDIDDIEYITYVPFENEVYSKGLSMLLMRKR